MALEKTISPERTREVMRAFARRVVSRARAKLTRDGINVTKNLYNEVRQELTVSKNSFSLKFFLGEYGAFRDEGVKGADPKLVKNGIQKAPNSQFKFKTKKPPVEPLIAWAKARKIRLRDSKGKFKKGSFRTIGFIIQNRVFAQGIKPSLFFTKPYESAFESLPSDVRKGYALDMSEFIKTTIQQTKKK